MQCDQCPNQASHSYTLAGRTLELCDRCFNRHRVQDAYEQQLPELELLAINGEYEKAIHKLQTIYTENSQYDHDGWLQKSILSHQALVLMEQGEFAAALENYRILATKEFDDPTEWLVNQLAIARVLDSMHKKQEAITALETGLDTVKSATLSTALALFVLYAQIAEKQGGVVPVKYAPLLRKVVGWWGLPVPDKELGNSSSLIPAIKTADKQNKAAQARYEALHRELAGQTERQRCIELTRQYIATETVTFYRDMAQRSCNT